MKRFICSLWLLALAAIWLAVPAGGSASRERSGACGENLVWVLDGEGVLNVSGTGDMDSFIEQSPGWSRLRVRKAVIEPGVTGIGALAFENCFDLESVDIPDTVTRIGDYAFDNCNALESVSLPAGIREIGANPFSGCDSLREVILPDGHPVFTARDGMLVSREDGRLICRCAGYRDPACAVPDGIRAVGDGAFAGCAGLWTVTLPEGVEEIGRGAFSGCGSLREISLPAGTVSVGAFAFSGCESLSAVTLRDGAESVGTGAFSGCKSLESIFLPDSLGFLGERPFEGCGELREIRVSPDHPYLSLEDGMLVTKTDWRLVFYEAGTGSMLCVIPEGTRVIGEKAFENGGDLREIVFPGSVREIGKQAFAGCGRVREITFSAGLERIGEEAFRGLDALEELILPEGLAGIGDHAFGGCGRLRTVSLPESVTAIGKGIFEGTDTVNLIVRVKGGSRAEAYCIDGGLKTALPEQDPEEIRVKMPYAFTDAYPGYKALFRLEVRRENEAAYLARTPEGTLVVLCGTEREGTGWTVIESAALPAESTVAMNGGRQMLDIGHARCTVRRYYDDVWGIGYAGSGDMEFGPKWFGILGALDRSYGIHPWADLTRMDWISLDDSWEELMRRTDFSALATPNRKNQKERTPLYTAPDGSGEKAADLVNGAPLFVAEKNEEWTHVRLGRDDGGCWQLDGWVRTENLTFGAAANRVVLADPGYLQRAGGDGEVTWITPWGKERIAAEDYNEETCFAVGERKDGTGEYWLIYDCDADRPGFVPKEQLREPNG